MTDWTARYDPNSDRVEGAVPGSRIYKHEQGHQFLWTRTDWDLFSTMINNIALIGCLSYLTFDMKARAFICILILISTQAFEEIFAWYYAFTH